MGYVLARIQLKYGNENLNRYNATIPVIADLFALEGISLRHGWLTQFGSLYEVWDVWEVDDSAHMSRARTSLRRKPEYGEAHEVLAEIIQSEDLRYVESLPFSPDLTTPRN
jgi:NIPSNAP